MVTSSERRRHRRFEVPCRLSVELPTGADLRARTINISDGGACFVSDEVLEVGRKVNVRLSVPRDTANTFFLEQFAARARVIRCEAPTPEDEKARVALQFEKTLELDLT